MQTAVLLTLQKAITYAIDATQQAMLTVITVVCVACIQEAAEGILEFEELVAVLARVPRAAARSALGGARMGGL